MLPRIRLAASFALISMLLVVALVCVVPSSASPQADGRIASASLSKTSFSASQTGSVKLTCKVSPASSRLNHLLQMKKAAKWTKLRAINRSGSFNGTYKMTVKQLFGSKPLKAGKYRVKISADTNSITKSFTIKASGGSGGSSGDGLGGGAVWDGKPDAGYWSSSGDGINFYVSDPMASSKTTILQFIYSLDASVGPCGRAARSVDWSAAEIADRSFHHNVTGLTYDGTFDSARTAHGTATITGYLTGCGSFTVGPLSWSATWRDSAPMPAPGSFGKVAPANGATGVATDVTFSWSDSSRTAIYQYCVDKTDNGECNAMDWVGTGTNSGYWWPPLDPDTDYYWQVRAVNVRDATHADGVWFHFRTAP